MEDGPGSRQLDRLNRRDSVVGRNLHGRGIKGGATQLQIPNRPATGHSPGFWRAQQTDEIEGEIFNLSVDQDSGKDSEFFGRSKRQAAGNQV